MNASQGIKKYIPVFFVIIRLRSDIPYVFFRLLSSETK